MGVFSEAMTKVMLLSCYAFFPSGKSCYLLFVDNAKSGLNFLLRSDALKSVFVARKK